MPPPRTTTNCEVSRSWSGDLGVGDAWEGLCFERVFPTGVGMVRARPWAPGESRCFPHGCGDGPSPGWACAWVTWFSPRVWGWSALAELRDLLARVFPTGVGMVRTQSRKLRPTRCFPHGCGDGPAGDTLLDRLLRFSPRVWGWSAFQQGQPAGLVVFPTGVGMVRLINAAATTGVRFPHGCGDGPGARVASFTPLAFSPRVWGWSGEGGRGLTRLQVFPTGVGMVRGGGSACPPPTRFPHGCGDGPRFELERTRVHGFSPRVWGWSERPHPRDGVRPVFPTGVGMVRA